MSRPRGAGGWPAPGWIGLRYAPGMSSTYQVIREITINAPAERIYGLIADFHEWDKWSPWDELDPEMNKTFVGSPSGVGAKYSWSGNRKAGMGSMEIVGADEPRRVTIDLAFVKPFKSRAATGFDLAATGDVTRVAWHMDGPKTFMVKVMSLFKSMDSMIGPDLEKGLAKLKSVAE